MARTRQSYTAAFKEKIVALFKVGISDAAYCEAARKLSRKAGALAKWVKPSDNLNPDDPEMKPFQIQEENRKLKRELSHLKKRSEVLVKTNVHFASKQL